MGLSQLIGIAVLYLLFDSDLGSAVWYRRLGSAAVRSDQLIDKVDSGQLSNTMGLGQLFGTVSFGSATVMGNVGSYQM